MESFQEKNTVMLREHQRELSMQYPRGEFIAIAEGQIVADAATFDELLNALDASDNDISNLLVVHTATNYAEEVFIVG